jgi:hypothetical protein
MRDVALFPIFGKWCGLRQINATGKLKAMPSKGPDVKPHAGRA